MKVLFLILSISSLLFVSQADAKKTRIGTKGVKQDVLISIRNVKNLLQNDWNDVFVSFLAGPTFISNPEVITIGATRVNRCTKCAAWTQTNNVTIHFSVAARPGFFSAGTQEASQLLNSCIEGDHNTYSTYTVEGYRNFLSRKTEKIIEFQAKCRLRLVDNTEPSSSPSGTPLRQADGGKGTDQPPIPDHDETRRRIGGRK